MNEALQIDDRYSTAEGARPPDATPNSAQNEETVGPLLSQDCMQDFRTRWDRIQTAFVDEPRIAVQQADELVGNAIQRLAESFSTARNSLETQWDRGDQVNTEDLRIALRKYRAFFQKILTAG
jgi:hypothetical protein